MNDLLKDQELDFSVSKSKYIAIYPSKKPQNNTGEKQKPVEIIHSYVGWVMDSLSNESIPYAKIRIAGSNRGVYTDEDGKFIIRTADKNFSVIISALGFRTVSIPSSKFKRRGGYRHMMTPEVNSLPEIKVEYLAEGMTISRDISSLQIRPSRLGLTPGTTEPDVFRSVQNIPGINSANETVSEMQIRGGTSDQNLLIWDGITLYHPGHFSGMISALNPYMVKSAEVHRGVYSPEFGGRASGLVNLKSIDEVPEKISFGAGVNLLDLDAHLTAPLGKKWAVQVAGRRSYTNQLETLTYNKYADRVFQQTQFVREDQFFVETFEDTTITDSVFVDNAFFFQDINAKVLFQPSPRSKTSISFIRTDNALTFNQNSVEYQSNIDLGTSTTGIGLTTDFAWSEKFKSSLTASFSQYQFYMDNLDVELEDSSTFLWNRTNGLFSIDWKLDNEYKLNDKHSIDFGYQGGYYDVNYSITEREDGELAYSEVDTVSSAVASSVYARHVFKNDKWLTKSGIRLTHLSLGNFILPQPRFYGQYALNRVFTVKASAGLQSQYLSQVEDIDQAVFGLSNRIWVLAEEDGEGLIQSQVYDVGFAARYKGWHFEVEGYFKSINGIVNFSDNLNFSSGFLRGQATSMGFDVLVKKRIKAYRTWLTYTLSDVLYEFDSGLGVFASPFNQPHVLRWVHMVNWKRFEASLAFKVASGKPYTKADGLTYDDEEEEWQINYGTINAERLPVYHRLDLSVMYTFRSPKEDSRWRLKVGGGVINLYDQKNYLSRTYRVEVDENDNPSTVTIDRYFLRFTPNFLFRIEFE